MKSSASSASPQVRSKSNQRRHHSGSIARLLSIIIANEHRIEVVMSIHPILHRVYADAFRFAAATPVSTSNFRGAAFPASLP